MTPYARRLGVLAALGCCLAGCGSQTVRATSPPASPHRGTECSGFAGSLVSTTGGQPSPVAAAQRYVRRASLHGFTSENWSARPGRGEATLRQHRVTLRVVEGPDHTWQVTSGTTCPPDPREMPQQQSPAG